MPEREDSIWKTFHRAHSLYAVWFNEKYLLSGHLFEDRPYSAPLDEDHLWAAIHYVECNPVRAGMVARAEDYVWSSAAPHCGLRSDPLIDVRLNGILEGDWSCWLSDDQSEAKYQLIRESTFTGLPCGNREFVQQAEALLGRSFTPRKPGPKPKREQRGAILIPELWRESE